MIDLPVGRELLDFGARIGPGQRADEQLAGAVALHNILETQKVAYLADEVGMGKTYVALGALALFRHFDPGFRVLIIAPRENIQNKWRKEFRNFVAHNYRIADMRVKGLDGRPARPLVKCDNLVHFIREVSIDRNRDFFLRLTSFSLPIAGRDAVDQDAAWRLRDGMRAHLPWLSSDIFDLRSRNAFKDNIARAVCCAIPRFDLVIVDEGHNLKHGFKEKVAARNRVLALAFGHREGNADADRFPGYGPRARRVLFLSATPVEESYAHLWNQLNVFGMAGGFEELRASDGDEDAKKAVAGRFLIRRVTSIKIGDEEYTKNLYRREWRRGGVVTHDEPIRIEDPRERLTVALVQKKVSEILGHERFGTAFQIGMLASFESFLETAKVKSKDADLANFDDVEQTEDDLEREGIDVKGVNRLAHSYRKRFGVEMPHPKMDSVVDALSDSWTTGRKALVFVRRVASVRELKTKLDERYDDWLIGKLRRELPEQVQRRLNEAFDEYKTEKDRARALGALSPLESGESDGDDPGGTDTFFAWFFRGEGPKRVLSGANIQQRFIQKGAVYSTFFEDNVVADVLGCQPGEVESTLAATVGVDRATVRTELRGRSRHFLTRAAKVARADRFRAVQGAAIEWLAEAGNEKAKLYWHELFESSKSTVRTIDAPEIGDWLELKTFFTELRQRPVLRAKLWPLPSGGDRGDSLREEVLRAQLLASGARLGHAFIDLYIMTIRRLGSLEMRAQESPDDASANVEVERIGEYLDLLERQMDAPPTERDWGAFDELAAIADNFQLVMDVNAPDIREVHLDDATRRFGGMLRQQQPIGGMSGQVSQTLVQQFRLPGYPLVLITTDLLQEGEDLHTFCSSVFHYGISWTPSAMEQRTGRIDRVRSATDRRLSKLKIQPAGGEKLQVYFPYLEDTVEIIQVQKVLDRMNTFLRLMHEGISTMPSYSRSVDTRREFVRPRYDVPQITSVLRSAFPVRDEYLHGEVRAVSSAGQVAAQATERFRRLAFGDLGDLPVAWESGIAKGTLIGVARLGSRRQPFWLRLGSYGDHPLVQCVSPVGQVNLAEQGEQLRSDCTDSLAWVGAIPTVDRQVVDITVKGDVLLGNTPESDVVRVSHLVGRVVRRADELENRLLGGVDASIGNVRAGVESEDSDDES